MEIQLGVKVRDVTCGIEGIIIQKVERLTGMTQWAVQPYRKESDETGKLPESWCIDGNTLEYIDEGIADRAVSADLSVNPKLGDEVEDTVSGYHGIATIKTTYLNGCVRFGVSQKMVYEKEKGQIIPKAEYFDHKQLRVTHRDAHRQPTPVSAKGGPSEKVTW